MLPMEHLTHRWKRKGKSHWDDYIDKRQAVLKKEQDEYHHTY